MNTESKTQFRRAGARALKNARKAGSPLACKCSHPAKDRVYQGIPMCRLCGRPLWTREPQNVSRVSEDTRTQSAVPSVLSRLPVARKLVPPHSPDEVRNFEP